MAQLLVRMDDDLKREADSLFTELGMNTQTAINVFLREALRIKGIPFEVRLDPFYYESNLKALEHSINQANNGELLVKTMDELRDMEYGD